MVPPVMMTALLARSFHTVCDLLRAFRGGRRGRLMQQVHQLADVLEVCELRTGNLDAQLTHGAGHHLNDVQAGGAQIEHRLRRVDLCFFQPRDVLEKMLLEHGEYFFLCGHSFSFASLIHLGAMGSQIRCHALHVVLPNAFRHIGLGEADAVRSASFAIASSNARRRRSDTCSLSNSNATRGFSAMRRATSTALGQHLIARQHIVDAAARFEM